MTTIEAAEILKQFNEKPASRRVNGEYVNTYIYVLQVLAMAHVNHLAEHPADSEPITVDYLDTIMKYDDSGHFRASDGKGHDLSYSVRTGTWLFFGIEIKQPKTRQDLRQLAAALGITLNS